MTEAGAEFLEIFRDEADERLDNMVATLLALESGHAPTDAVDSLFRDAHTIKGAAGMLGLDSVQELAHAVEDVLDDLRRTGDFPPELADPLLRAADSLRQHVHGDGEGTADLLDELARSRTRTTGAPKPLPVEHALDEEEEPQPELERRSIRVPAEKLDRLLDLVGETMLQRQRLVHTLGERAGVDEEISGELDVGDRLFGELQDTAIEMRTLPLASITGPFPRAVRDLAVAEGKRVELVVTGEATELDRVILESLSEPIVHMLRNSVAHGIEPPEERRRLGKPAQGRIELRAEQRGRMVAVVVADDGRGAPHEALDRTHSTGETLVDALTASGFSTSTEVTGLSGRGVGLHVVRVAVEAFGGSMSIESEPGRGMEITLLLPLTLALLDVLLFERGGQTFGVPLSAVEEAVAVGDPQTLAGRPSLQLRGASLPLWDLAELVGAEAPPPGSNPPALIVSATGRRVAALCDTLIGEQEVVVRSLGSLLAGLDSYLGASVLPDGSIALLLDPSTLVRPTDGRPRAAQPRAEPEPKRDPTILVVEDSFTVRELQRSILEAAGYRVATARDGHDALVRLAEDDAIGLVITDIEMRGLDGFDLVRAIRADPDRGSLPVIIVTTRASDADRSRGFKAGANAYMAKRSFNQQALLDTVRELVGRA